ncbi:MAG: lytic transglycosylase domain-containing protein, partial [Deltaproteobacteria bacterium]|nr:lytic transglycosylase domain-containing protein [Deltaproteobacteria bacterium]
MQDPIITQEAPQASPLGQQEETLTDEEIPYWERPLRDSGQPYWVPKGQPYPNTGSSLDSNPQANPPANSSGAVVHNFSSEESFFAPPPPPPPPAAKRQTKKNSTSEFVVEEISYYMFKDEDGVTHMTDAPVDPRYRLVKVQITISRGLAPFRSLTLEKVKPFILAASRRYNLEPALIAAIIKAESAFDPKAVSWAGARGLMQLMPNTAKLVGVSDSFDPEQNIMGGSKYLRMMLNRFNGNLTLAIAAYNCGPERVARVNAIPEITETKNYVRTVLANLEIMGAYFTEEDLVRPPQTPQTPPTPMYVENSPLDLPPLEEALTGKPPEGVQCRGSRPPSYKVLAPRHPA